MAKSISTAVAMNWREHGGVWLLEHDQHELGRAWPHGNLWLGRFGGSDASGGGRRYPTLDAAREALATEAETRVLDLLSDDAHAALRQTGLL